jgi:DNA-binding transcriptional MerR regulator
LHSILLLRQLQFPLKQIKDILDSPGFDPLQALEQQIRLLELQREHLDNLIAHARKMQETGVFIMDFSTFDTAEMDRYAAEAKKKWGETNAYREFSQKTSGKTKAQMDTTGEALMGIFAEFGVIRHLSPASGEAQALVSKLQDFITHHYYNCTKQILRGLGQLYIAGDSMTENIDTAGGEGTAQFVHQAIEIYCS